jgi:hypothetical protein
MKENFTRSVFIFIVLAGVIAGSIYQLYKSKPTVTVTEAKEDYSQPSFPKAPSGTWSIRSIDTQVISKHWQDVTPKSIEQQVSMLKELGVNYIAIGTPYDRPEEIRMWADEIHKQGLNVWFRSHWLEWEGDDGRPATMSSDEYLRKTAAFIRANPELFKEGDSFTIAVEPEQVGVGLGKRFLDWDAYRRFVLLQVTTANHAFKDIGMENKIHTNWISVNGWIVDNQFDKNLVEKLGLITVDHFVGQSQTRGDLSDGDDTIKLTEEDLDRFHNKWEVPILLGEWGYQIYQETPEDLQADVVNNMLTELQNKDYLVGLNYWVHMGHNSKIINDEFGDDLSFRQAAGVLQSHFDPESDKLKVSPSKTPNEEE